MSSTTRDSCIRLGETFCYSKTDEDGNCLDLLEPSTESSRELAILRKGIYKITFQTKSYFEATNRDCFYPWIEVAVESHDYPLPYASNYGFHRFPLKFMTTSNSTISNFTSARNHTRRSKHVTCSWEERCLFVMLGKIPYNLYALISYVI